MSIILYTQPKCPFCDIMKNMLDKTGYAYYSVNIQENNEAKMFLVEEGHRTVPQLYVNEKHINKKNTDQYTPDELRHLIGKNL